MGKVESKLAEKVDIALDASVTIEADPLGLVPTASFAVAASLGGCNCLRFDEKKNFSRMIMQLLTQPGSLEEFDFKSGRCNAQTK